MHDLPPHNRLGVCHGATSISEPQRGVGDHHTEGASGGDAAPAPRSPETARNGNVDATRAFRTVCRVPPRSPSLACPMRALSPAAASAQFRKNTKSISCPLLKLSKNWPRPRAALNCLHLLESAQYGMLSRAETSTV